MALKDAKIACTEAITGLRMQPERHRLPTFQDMLCSLFRCMRPAIAWALVLSSACVATVTSPLHAQALGMPGS